MTNILLLINNNVPSTSVLVDACLPNVSVVLYDQNSDTFSGLLEKIATLNISTFDEVGIVFDGMMSMSMFTLLNTQLSASILNNVQIDDPELSSWSEISDFLGELANIYSMKTLDFFACSLYSNPSWQYVFNTISAKLEILIQASTDMTGNVTSGANWVMESDGVNIKDVYFNSNILLYPFVFGVTNDIIFYKNGVYWGGGQNYNGKYGANRQNVGIALFNMATIVNVLPTFPSGFAINSIIDFASRTALISMSTKQIVWVAGSGGYNLFDSVPTTYNSFVDIVGNTACLIWNTNNTITVFGFNDYGAFGNGTTSTTKSTMNLPVGKTIAAIGAGWNTSYVIFTDGTIYACGYNGNGGLGDGTTTNRSSLTAMNLSGIPAGLTPIQVLAGLYSCAIVFIDASGNKSIYSCGANITGTFGRGDTAGGSNTLVPMDMSPIAGLSIVTIDYGQYTLMMICSDSSGNLSVWGVGWNGFGQMGLGNTNNITSLTKLTTLPTGLVPQALHCAAYFCAIVFTDNSLWFAGNNTGFYGIGASVLNMNYTSWTNLVPASAYPILLSDQFTAPRPAAPTSLVASATGISGSISVSFSSTASNITNYTYSTDGINYTAFSPEQTTSPVTISGLTNGTAYTFYLKAVTMTGMSLASSASGSTTPVIGPNAPTGLVASAAGVSGTISVSFSSTSLNIINYMYSTNGSSFTSLSPAQTASPVTISGLTNGTSYTLYLKAVNSSGSSVASAASGSVTPYTNPAAPTSLVASAAGVSGTISLAFSAGSNNGSAISNYKYSTDGTNFTAFSPAQTASPVTISGLTNGTSYTLYLKAVNSAGESVASAAASGAVTPYTNPAAPTTLVASAAGVSGTISLAFSAGLNNGSAISNYKYSTDGTNFTTFSPAQTASPVTINGLTNGTSYTLYLKAVNSAGESVASAAASGAVTPYTNPAGPTSLVVSATGVSGTLSVAFTSGSNNGSAISNYMYSTDGTNFTTFSPAQTASPVTISGLTNGTAYTLYLKAVNSAGESSASAASGSVSPYTNPDAPTNLVASAAGVSGTISVAFTAGSNNGSPITNYWYSTDGINFTSLSSVQTASPVTISGLTNGTSYTLYLKAANLAGVSSASAASGPITPYIIPSAPVLSSAGGIVIDVNAGTSGSNIMNYQWSTDNSIWTSMSPAQITTPFTFIPPGLSIGPNTIYIRAINIGNGVSSSISVSVPLPSYTEPNATISGSINAGALSSNVTTVAASSDTTLSVGALANTQVRTVNLSAATNITSIPANTFAGCTSLKQVTLPESVTTIDANAFSGCTSLTQVTLPASVTSISAGAFIGCSSLVTLVIPASVTIIGANALSGTAITSITLSNGVTISSYAFANCISMVTATI